MSYLLPKIQFLRDNYITLNEGFDRVGGFMFPDYWTGLEALAWPQLDPADFRAEKVKLEKNFNLHSQRARDVRSTDTFGMEEGEYKEHRHQFEKLEKQRQAAREKMDQFGQTYDTRYSDALAYDRRQKVESRLCKMIKNEELDVRLGNGIGVSMGGWFTSDRFHISFAFSYIIAPEQLGKRRRFPAYFIKKEFDTWARPFETEIRQYNSESIEEQMLVWFRHYRDQRLEQSERPTKGMAQTACEKNFGPSDLPEHFKNKFDAVWKLLAPEAWQKGGAPKKP